MNSYEGCTRRNKAALVEKGMHYMDEQFSMLRDAKIRADMLQVRANITNRDGFRLYGFVARFNFIAMLSDLRSRCGLRRAPVRVATGFAQFEKCAFRWMRSLL